MDKQAQIKKIQEIMGEPEEVPFYRFPFGKFRGRTLEYVYKNHEQYLKWLYNNVEDLNPTLEGFIQEKILH